MEKLNILLLGAGNRVSLCEWLISSGIKHNREVNIFSLEIKNPVPISEYAKIIIGEKWDSPNFEQSLLNIIKENEIHIVLPLMDAATVALSKIKDTLDHKTPAWIAVSDFELCKVFNNKCDSEKWFISNSVRVPFGNSLMPQIFKSIEGYGARDQFIVDNEIEFLKLIQDKSITSRYFYQPFIKGPEYTVDAYVALGGKLLGAVSRLRLETINGEVSRGLTKKEPELLEEVKRILSIPGFIGPITLQAIKCNITGLWYFIEINPRFGGGVIQSFKAGANFAEALILDYLTWDSKNLPTYDDWEEGILMLRANREFFHRI